MSLLKEQIELKIQEAEAETDYILNKFPKWEKWVIIVCLISTIPAYFISKNFSHKLWQEKYKQYELVAKPSFQNPKTPKFEAFDITTSANGAYTAIATLQNENLDLSAQNVGFEFQFFNEKGQNVAVLGAELKGKTFFLPNEKKYLLVPKFTSLEPITGGRVVLDDKIAWQKKLKIPKVKVTPYTPNIKNQLDPVAFVLEGSFKNESGYQIKTVRLTFLVFSNDKKIIAASQRDEYDLLPRERRTIKQIWPDIFTMNALKGQIIAEVNTLNTGNLVPEKPVNSSASDLSRPETQ